MEVVCSKDSSASLSFQEKQLAFLLVSGEGRINGQKVTSDDLAIVKDPNNVELELNAGAHVMIVGGTPFPEPRYIWWNFVSSRVERIRTAAGLWREQKMGTVNGESDFIPLPDIAFPVER